VFILVSIQPLLIWLPCLLSLCILLWTVLTAPWRYLFSEPSRQHLFFAASLVLGLSWATLSVGVDQLYSVHPLIITSAVFIFGLRFSLILGGLALLTTHAISLHFWENIGYHYLVNVVTPAIISVFILYFIDKLRIQNLFVYILGGGFFGSMLTVILTGVVALLSLWISGSSLQYPVFDKVYLFAMLTFPEGFTNGAIITALTVVRPDLVKTYDDKFYLDGSK
jgi:uncharacterized membrane protein